MRNLLIKFLLLLPSFLYLSCSEDSEKKKLEYVLGSNSVSLADANLYLVYSEAACWQDECAEPSHTHYAYVITDGTYSADPGCSEYYSLDGGCFTGSTFLLQIDIGVPDGEDFMSGDYSEIYSYSNIEADDMFCNYYLTLEDYYYGSTTEVNGERTMTLTGGFTDGETLTIEYSGKAEDYIDESIQNFKFYFKGVIVNKIAT